MENKDNNIIVNAKPNTILLQSSEEEVTGGYYDGEGEWHEFGDSDTFAKVTMTLEMDESVTETFTFDTFTVSGVCGFVDIDGVMYFGDGITFMSGATTVVVYYPKNIYNTATMIVINVEPIVGLQNGGASVDTSGYEFYFEVTDSDCIGENGDIISDGTMTVTLYADSL